MSASFSQYFVEQRRATIPATSLFWGEYPPTLHNYKLKCSLVLSRSFTQISLQTIPNQLHLPARQPAPVTTPPEVSIVEVEK